MVAAARTSDEFVLTMLELLNISHDNRDLLLRDICTGCQALLEDPKNRQTIIEKLASTIQQFIELRSNQIHDILRNINGKSIEKGILAIISSYDVVVPKPKVPGVTAGNNAMMPQLCSSSSNSFRDISSSSSSITNLLYLYSSSFRGTSALHHSRSNQAVGSMPLPTTRQEIQEAISMHNSRP
jgi:hypothetical protein